MAIDLKLIDKLLAEYKEPEDIIGEHGLLKQLTKAVLERAMQAEMTEHLGYEKHDQAGNNSGNSRNGKTTKALKGDFGEVPLETPRDRNGTFEPKIVAKGQTRFTGFDDKIVSMYARGMSTREITGHLQEIYGVEVSPTLISSVTEAVMEEVKLWQGRPLEPVYPIVYLDALYVKIRDAGHIRNRAIYVAIGVNLKGNKEVLGLWTGETEGATAAERDGETTHLCTADMDGNIVSLIQSVYLIFGSGVLVDGYGFHLQNRAGLFEFDTASPNVLAPRKRPFHTLIACVVKRDGVPVMGLSNMGGDGQAMFHTQILTNTLDYGMEIQEAIERPRFFVGRLDPSDAPDLVRLESRVPAPVREALVGRGHNILPVSDWFSQEGQAHAVAVLKDGVLRGGADPRGDGAAVGY